MLQSLVQPHLGLTFAVTLAKLVRSLHLLGSFGRILGDDHITTLHPTSRVKEGPANNTFNGRSLCRLQL